MAQNIPLSSFSETEKDFLQMYPEMASTALLDQLRANEYPLLDSQNQVYLDYTGGGLTARCQLQEHFQLLQDHIFGNPHSLHPPSMAMTKLVEQTRAAILAYFQASPAEYSVIFTPNASGALKLIGESYPFQADSTCLLLVDNHNSVNGIREFARARGAEVVYLPVEVPELRVNELQLTQALEQRASGSKNLFAYPAQSNFSGVQHPLQWIERAQKAGWDVILDAAAFVPSNTLDLSYWHPDFLTLSFYKMFGYPTGIGCLLARKEKMSTLRRPWFAGGTIWAVSVVGDWYELAEDEAAYEDGTINYLSLPAVEIGLRYLQSVGMEIIHRRISCLGSWLLDALTALRHDNGQKLVSIYGPLNMEMRGGTISFNLLDPAGTLIDERIVAIDANEQRIALRTGCFCNPGVGETIYGVTEDMVKTEVNKEHFSYDQYLAMLGLQNGGGHRVSLGLVSNFADVYRFLHFIRTFLNVYPAKGPLPQREHC